jgi:radical SAM-linked protein
MQQPLRIFDMDNKIRLKFSKTGKARYISHLDLMATMRRALRRAGIGLEYSKGFNPHPDMSVALPLPVGCESVCELMDFRPKEPTLPDTAISALNASLPEGLEITEAYAPQRKFPDIAWVEVKGTLFYGADSADGADTVQQAIPRIAERISMILAQKSIIITKKTKRGESEMDIAPHIRDAQVRTESDANGRWESVFGCNSKSGVSEASGNETDDSATHKEHTAIVITAKLSAQNPSVTPSDIIAALGELKPGYEVFARTQVFDANMIPFK